MPTNKQDALFADYMSTGDILITSTSLSNSALDLAIGWIQDNLDPDDVFDQKDLESWAEANGYIKE
jgi:hypothetical protein